MIVLVVGNDDGDILGRKELTNTRWRITGDMLVNQAEIVVPIDAGGVVTRIGMIDADGYLYNAIGSFYDDARHSVGVRDTLSMRAGQLHWLPSKVGKLKRDKLTNQLRLTQDYSTYVEVVKPNDS